MITCKNCGVANAPGAARCTTCHAPGDFGRAPAAPARAPEPEQLRPCGNCAAHLDVRARHCPRCRWPQPAVKTPVRPAPKPRPAPSVHFEFARHETQ